MRRRCPIVSGVAVAVAVASCNFCHGPHASELQQRQKLLQIVQLVWANTNTAQHKIFSFFLSIWVSRPLTVWNCVCMWLCACVCVFVCSSCRHRHRRCAKEEAQQTKMVYDHCNLFKPRQQRCPTPTPAPAQAAALATASALAPATLYSLISHEAAAAVASAVAAAAAAGPLLTYIWFRTSSSSQTCGLHRQGMAPASASAAVPVPVPVPKPVPMPLPVQLTNLNRDFVFTSVWVAIKWHKVSGVTDWAAD